MDVQKILSSLDAGAMREQLLEAIHLERRRSTMSKAVMGFAIFGLGAAVGAALLALMKMRSRVAAQPAVETAASEKVASESAASEKAAPSERHPLDRSRDGIASA